MSRLIHKYIESHERKLIGHKQFAIISDNCWGYELYNALNREYNTPFIGLFIQPDDYIKLLSNFMHYMNSELTFIPESINGNAYPVGMLDNTIKLYFMHYADEQEAYDKWTRRTRRLVNAIDNGTRLFIKFGVGGYSLKNMDYLKQFHSLEFGNKLSIGLMPFESKQHIFAPQMADKSKEGLVQGRRLYRKRCHYFDISEWITHGVVRQSFFCRAISLIS